MFYYQAKIALGLKELRDKSVFFFAVFNALFVLIVFMLTLNKDILHIDWPFGVKENSTLTKDNQVGRTVHNGLLVHGAQMRLHSAQIRLHGAQIRLHGGFNGLD